MSYYTRKLGFQWSWDWGKPPTFGCISRDGIEIFLCLREQGQPGTWLSIMVADVDALHKELRKRGATIARPPKNESWGMREFHARDPDGHTIRFGQCTPTKDLKIKRVALSPRIEKRLAAVVSDLAKATNRTVGEVLEETLLHTFEPVPTMLGQAVASPHSKPTFQLIERLKKKHGLDYDTHANYRFTER